VFLAVASFTLTDENPIIPKKGSLTIQDFRNELDDFYKEIALFYQMDSVAILQRIAAYTARMSYVRALIMRQREVRELTNFRIKELDPFLEEVDRQFRVWSRIVTIQQREFDQTSKAF
jgi:hypothetical protein